MGHVIYLDSSHVWAKSHDMFTVFCKFCSDLCQPSQVVEETLGVRLGGRAVEGRPRGGEGHGVGAAHAAVIAAQGQPATLS